MWPNILHQLGAAANFDDLVKFGDRRQIRRSPMFIARPKGVPPKAARPKDGLFRLHASWIYLSYAGFDCLAAILCH